MEHFSLLHSFNLGNVTLLFLNLINLSCFQDPYSLPPSLKNELIVDRLASIQIRSRYETLRVEAAELETQIKQLQDALDTMVRIQQR